MFQINKNITINYQYSLNSRKTKAQYFVLQLTIGVTIQDIPRQNVQNIA